MARILVAEDEPNVREFLVEALELASHDVVGVDRGDTAAAMLGTAMFDVLLSDLNMPGMDGMELLAVARREQPDLQVIILTAHGTVETAVRALKLGAFDYLQKPIAGLDELRLMVARAAEKKRLLTAEDRATRGVPGADPMVQVTLTWGDPVMAGTVKALERVAPTSATVLLLGESGTGKEVAAQALHAMSRRAKGPFVAVNCAALSASLLESELFGHEKGAFTGASARRRGRIELAQGGSFFLDEVGELRGDLQAKLLRVLEERTFERVGGGQTIEADVRWIAATNRDLLGMVKEGTFREDLYHRLAVFPIRLPPLRERPLDILPLAAALLTRIAHDLGRRDLVMSDETKTYIKRSAWPGNARALRNALERAAILASADGVLRHTDMGVPDGGFGSAASSAPPVSIDTSLEALERQAIVQALDAVAGNRRKAADRLGIALRTLYNKLKRYDLD
ncbi:MAG: two-component system response regulator AtoC [Myxococcota bacterium]|jgi:two-component system response regulator AtoC